MPINLGYCCINTRLQAQGITTSRGMIKRTFDDKGITYASQLALQNTQDLITVLEWNAEHNIKVFRMGSDLFPWASQYKFIDLPDFVSIVHNLEKAGQIALQTNQRLSFHPDHFVKLGSEKPEVVANSVKELELHASIMDFMGLSATPYNPINIHVGMNFSKETAQRWIDGAFMLSGRTRARLVVENDDKKTGFSVQQLYDNIHKVIGIPITFDYFHHEFHPDGLTTEQAAKLAASTWGTHTPLFHYSESKLVNENADCNPRAHSDYVYGLIPDFDLTLDIDLEAKAKEEALLKYQYIHRL
jgi:UV DNA damage endonuclease